MRGKPRHPPAGGESDLEIESESAAPASPQKRGLIRPDQKSGGPGFSFTRRVARDPADDVASLDREDLPTGGPASVVSDPGSFGKQHDRNLPRFLPNRILGMLESVSEGDSTDRLEKRARRVVRLTTVAILVGVVVAVVGATLLFSSRAPRASGTLAPARAIPTISEAEWQSRVVQARDVATRFFASTSFEEKRQLAAPVAPVDDERLKRYHERTGGKDASIPHLDEARPVRSGASLVLLLPVGASTGDRRTAAIIETPQGFRVDWRSVTTPESVDWGEFAREKPAEAHLFRVRIAAANSKEPATGPEGWRHFAITHANEPPITAGVPAGSRVSAELDRLLGDGRTAASHDVYLQFEAAPDGSRHLRITDVIPDKWTL